MTMQKSINHQIDRIIERHHEPRHMRISDRNGFPLFYLFYPQRNDTSSTAHYISVTSTAYSRCGRISQLSAFGYGHFLHQCFRYSHSIDWVGRFVRRENHNIFHPMFDSRIKYIFCSQHIRMNGLYREKLTRRHLFECGCVEYIIHTGHHPVYRTFIAYIPDIEFHLRILKLMTHIVLLFFIPAEYPDLSDIAVQKPP